MYYSFLLLVAILAATGTSWDFTAGGELDRIIEKEERVLVAFVAPETTPCTNLESEWASLALNPAVSIISIDCTLSPKTCASHDVVSFPAIRLYHGPKYSMIRYRGERTSQALTSFLSRALRPLITPITPQTLSVFQASDDIVFTAYIPVTNTELLAQYSAVAKKHHLDCTFGKLESKGQITRIEFRRGEEVETWDMSTEAGALEGWVEKVMQPIVGRLTRRNEMEYLSSGKSLLYMFAPSLLHAGLQKAFVPLAKHYAEYISFLVIDSTEYANMLPQMGLQGRGFPCAALYNPKMGQVFRFEGGNVVPSGVEEFINGIVSGQIRALDLAEEGVENSEHGHGAHDEL